MRVLFVARQEKNVEVYLDTLRHRIDRGHAVAVAVQERDEARDRRLAQQIASERCPVVACPSARIDEWASVAPLVRRLRHCLHFLQPPFAGLRSEKPDVLLISPLVHVGSAQGSAPTVRRPSLRTAWLEVDPRDEEPLARTLDANGFRIAPRRVRRRSVQLAFSR